jgi:hypothetical protein
VKLEARLTSGVVLRFGQTTTTFRFHGEEAGAFANDLPGVADQGITADSELGTLPRIEVGSTVLGEASAGVKEAATGSTQRTPTLPKEGAALLAGIAAAPSVEVSLEILEGADSGAVRKFKQESVLIGRLNTDLVVRDSDVSRRHTIIEVFDGSQIYLRDLNSTNGTFVNGRRVSSVRLRNGDQVRLGRCLLRFSARPL